MMKGGLNVKTEMELLKNIEQDLVKKLLAVRELMKMFQPDAKIEPIEIISEEIEQPFIERIKVLSLQKLIEAIRDIFTSDLHQKVKDKYALSAYVHYAKVMHPKTGFADIGMLIGLDSQGIVYQSKKHDILLDKYPDYADYIKRIETKYAIKPLD